MNSAFDVKRLDQRPMKDAILSKNKFKILGRDSDELIRLFFAGNAWVAIVILALITFSLFREGLGFFPQHLDNLKIYRQAGLEYVDIVRDQVTAHGGLVRFLQKTRQDANASLTTSGKTEAEIAATLAPLDAYIRGFDESIVPLNDVLSEMTTTASDVKERWTNAANAREERQTYLDAKMPDEAAAVVIEEVDLKSEVGTVTALYPKYIESSEAFKSALLQMKDTVPVVGLAETDAQLARFSKTVDKYAEGFPLVVQRLKDWSPDKSYGAMESFTRFIFGPKWTTQSFWQDWYGFLPLFVGSLTISFVALVVAVPFGVGAAIYINQLASIKEQQFIKPYIEFISAIPSVVLGFFGIAVLGTAIRDVSNGFVFSPEAVASVPAILQWLPNGVNAIISWLVQFVPFFPISERLNITTAGLLLGLMAVPTIFTLAEDAINNVPRAFKEASFALGANRMQTITRIIVPAALSGIISAVLLGFGRVIGETMVVLMCAGNRIEIPDITQGLGFAFEPVHTMTGLIAQEIPEVVQGSLQYRGLFMLAIMLFLISLGVNYLAQMIVKKYRISIG
jgi:phosphate transport system permease protein